MPYDDDVDTQQDVDVDVTNDVDGNSNDGSDDQGDEPFLVVNDRQQYKTREEAVRGIQEAGETIARLSAWDKELERYGVKDPRVAAQLFDELLEARKKLAEAEKAAKESSSKSVQSGNDKQTTTTDDSDLSKEDQAALKWLKKHAPRLGFVPQTELQSLKDELQKQIAEQGKLIDGFKQQGETAKEEQRQSLIADGQSSVKQWLATDKISDPDGAKQNVIETLVTAWINQDEKRVNRFYAGGSSLTSLLKEGYDLAKKTLGWGTQPATSDAVNKGRQLHRNRSLPQAGAAGQGRRQNDGVKRDAGGRKDHIGSVHTKAWEMAQKHFSGTSAE